MTCTYLETNMHSAAHGETQNLTLMLGSMLQGYTRHYPCSGEELAAALASSLSEPRQAEPVPERAPYTSPSTLKSSSTMRSTSDTAGGRSKPVTSHACEHVGIQSWHQSMTLQDVLPVVLCM